MEIRGIETSNSNRREADMLQTLKRLVIEEHGMEMVEWAIVGVVFAVAAAAVWGTLETSIANALGDIGEKVDPAGSGTGTGTGTGTTP
jgi:Flp pilus assembly pilin Flp